jgi:hypothetical protein
MTIKNPNEFTVYDLDIHDEMQVTDDTWATRVPGGWLYQTLRDNQIGGFDMTSCFVPFDNEFQGS